MQRYGQAARSGSLIRKAPGSGRKLSESGDQQMLEVRHIALGQCSQLAG